MASCSKIPRRERPGGERNLPFADEVRDDAILPPSAGNSRIFSFPPVADRRARLLILGSMPGIASLRAGQYYAHPRNLFWPLMGEIVGAGPELSYAARLARLRGANIALWDVLRSCVRDGSLDTKIDAKSIQVNDFDAFFADHPAIETILFNGAMAESCFRRHVLPALPASPERRLCRLPSTSPAHAGMSYALKCEAWRSALSGE